MRKLYKYSSNHPLYLGIGVNGKKWGLEIERSRSMWSTHSQGSVASALMKWSYDPPKFGRSKSRKLFGPVGAGVRHRLNPPWPPYRRSSLPSIQHNDATQPNIEIFRRCERPETGAGAKRSPKKMEKKREKVKNFFTHSQMIKQNGEKSNIKKENWLDIRIDLSFTFSIRL